MQTFQPWAYPARIERHDGADFVVTFADVPEALTGGDTRAEAELAGADALAEALLAYMAAGRPLPLPRDAAEGEALIPLDPVTAARCALVMAMREDKVTNVALAQRMAKSEGSVRRLVDGHTGVKIDTVLDALAHMGRRATLAVAPL